MDHNKIDFSLTIDDIQINNANLLLIQLKLLFLAEIKIVILVQNNRFRCCVVNPEKL